MATILNGLAGSVRVTLYRQGLFCGLASEIKTRYQMTK
jgi:hypothetical protein